MTTAKRIALACICAAAFCLLLAAAVWRHPRYRARRAVEELMHAARADREARARGAARPDGVKLYLETGETLSRLGPAGMEAVARELRSDDEWRRSDAYFLLLAMDVRAARPPLVTYAELAADERLDFEVRFTLADILLSHADDLHDPSVERHMSAALGGADPELRGLAAAILWRMGRRGEELIEPLAQVLESFPRVHIVGTIVADVDGPDGPSLQVRDEEQDKTTLGEETAIEALRSFGEKAVPALAAAVAEGDGSPRAADLLAELGPKAAPAAPALVGRLVKGWHWIPEDYYSELLQPEDDPAERALGAIGPAAADAITAKLKELPEGEERRIPRLRLLLLLDRMGCVTLDVALLHLYGKNERRSRWGAWHVTKSLLEAAPSEPSSQSALRPGDGGSPPECMDKLLERRWVVVGLLEKDYEQLPSKYPGIPYMRGGGPKEPWWETVKYDRWVKALGYRRAGARRLGAWLIGMDAKDDPKVRGCGDIPSALLKCADDPDEGVRSAARWAMGILRAEPVPGGEVNTRD